MEDDIKCEVLRMTDTEWNTAVDPGAMLERFVDDPYKAELGIFGCACCRRVWTLLSDERLTHGVEVREQYERGLVSEEEVRKAARDAGIARSEIRTPLKFSPNVGEQSVEAAPAWAAAAAASAAVGNYHAASKLAARARACAESSDWQKSYDMERAAQCDLLRSMVGNPFCPK
jgi:hypothetical protein